MTATEPQVRTGSRSRPADRPPIDSVLIAVTTYGRNTELPALLPLLSAQAAQAPVRCGVLLVDNNPAGEAEPVVGALGLPNVDYVHEPEPGIAAGRNRALDWAADYRAVAFIDDDETPSEGWLANLVATADDYACAGVAGRVVRQHEHRPPLLVQGIRRWERDDVPTGAARPAASSANLLLDLDFLREHGLRFDPDFGLSGGSDTLLTKQLLQAGGTLIWCNEAVVVDHVVAQRLTAEWSLGRNQRVGNTTARVSLAMADGRRERSTRRLKLLAQGSALQVVGALASGVGRLERDDVVVGGGRARRARGLGLIEGALGRTMFDYKRG